MTRGNAPYNVIYQGRGIGHESVLVDGAVALRLVSFLWFAPRFPFRIGSHDAAIEVRIWPWLAIRSFRLSVDGEAVYSEGGEPLSDGHKIG